MKKKTILIIAACAVLALAFIIGVTVALQRSPSSPSDTPPPVTGADADPDVIQAFAVKNPCYAAAQPITPRGIVVHSTGVNNPNLRRYVDAEREVGKNPQNNTWNNGDMNVCVHAFIGYDKDNNVRVAQILPYNVAAWGVGNGEKGSFNYDPTGYIQFEMCEDDMSDGEYFGAVYAKAVEYCAGLCARFGFDPLGENVIVSHKEAYDLGYATNHNDPVDWFAAFGKTMDGFRADVKSAM